MIKRLFILVALVALSSCASKEPKKQIQNSSAARAAANVSYMSNTSMTASVEPAKGEIAGEFSWYNSDGKKISLTSLRGKTVLINFWATWCGPCKAELPDIEAVSKEYAQKGLVVVGVSEDRGPGVLDDVSSFVQKHGLTYQIVIDNDNIAGAYGGINAIPTSFIINKDGKIADKWIGLKGKSFFESTVKKYLY